MVANQADIFNKKVVSLKNEQGPGMGAAILAATGLGWFDTVQDAAAAWNSFDKEYLPDADRAARYAEIHAIYKQVYGATAEISHELLAFRRSAK